MAHLIEWIKDKIKYREITSVRWIDTKRMLADCLTKAGVDTQPLLNVLERSSLKDAVDDIFLKDW